MICNLCPRRCGVERTPDKAAGVCAMPAWPVAARAMLHQWEEPCLVGEHGAGAVFFSGCNLRCKFCQNGVISQEGYGKPITPRRLRPSLEGWCPGHCATPACALHSNRQLVHITIGHRPCQEKNRRTGHFSVETALSTLRRQSQRAGDGQKSAVCYTGNNKKKRRPRQWIWKRQAPIWHHSAGGGT